MVQITVEDIPLLHMALKVGQAVGVSWEDHKEVAREERGRSLLQISTWMVPRLTAVCRAHTAKTRSDL